LIIKKIIISFLTTLVLIFSFTSVNAEEVQQQYYARVVTDVFDTRFTYRISAHDPAIDQTKAEVYLDEIELLTRVVSHLTDNFKTMDVKVFEIKENSKVYQVTKEDFGFPVGNGTQDGKIIIKIEIDNNGLIMGYEEVYFEIESNELTSFLNLIIGENIKGIKSNNNDSVAKKAVVNIINYIKIENLTSSTVNIYQINNRPNERVEIDKLLYDILVLSEQYKKITNGYFDISIGLVIDEWKEIIDYNNKYTEEELNKKIDNILKIPVIKDGILLEEEEGKYFVTIKDGVKIDLGAVAKGYIASLVNDYFKSKNLTFYNILGSDSSLIYGENYYREGNVYNVGFNNPLDATDKSYVKVKNTSITTSGDTVQHRVLYGNLYHHLISPKTKRPENNYRLLTVIHEDPIFGEALTTAMFAMDEKTLKEFTEENGVEDYIIFKSNGDIIEVFNNYEFVIDRNDDPISSTLIKWVVISVVVIFVAGGLLLITKEKKDWRW